MSIFGSIMNSIFPSSDTAAASPDNSGATQQSTGEQTDNQSNDQATSQTASVDIEDVLSTMANQKGGGGNWRSSIVDLLKLLGLDSSLSARKELANELNVHVAGDGSAEENTALHRAVMQKLEENGGKVPDSLKG